MPAIASQENKPVARPLKVLVPLIKEDLKQGDEAAKAASMPYYRAAGEKLNEARHSPGVMAAEFWGWATRNFERGKSQLSIYMQLDKSAAVTKQDFDSIKEFRRTHLGHDVPTSGGSMRQPAWQAPVKESILKAQQDALRYAREQELTRQEERAAEKKLALQLIDIGFKALASKLHPDKGGSRDAMSRLNRVRERLKSHA